MHCPTGYRHRWLEMTMAIASLLAMASPAKAQAPVFIPTPQAGYALADKLCKGCHLLEGSVVPSLPTGVPSMRAIANKAGQTGGRISDTLMMPTHPMPDLQMTSEEIANIVTFLESLRTNPAVKPLIEIGPPPFKPNIPPKT